MAAMGPAIACFWQGHNSASYGQLSYVRFGQRWKVQGDISCPMQELKGSNDNKLERFIRTGSKKIEDSL